MPKHALCMLVIARMKFSTNQCMPFSIITSAILLNLNLVSRHEISLHGFLEKTGASYNNTLYVISGCRFVHVQMYEHVSYSPFKWVKPEKGKYTYMYHHTGTTKVTRRVITNFFDFRFSKAVLHKILTPQLPMRLPTKLKYLIGFQII